MFKVIEPGFYSTIQDSGRIGYQEYGVPLSGSMDNYSARIANTLVGNQENAAVIEITLKGPKLQFSTNSLICISGAFLSPKLNDVAIENNKAVSIRKGDVVSFGNLLYGIRSYLAVLGGIKSEKVMQSRSMFKGITPQIRIQKDDTYQIESNISESKSHASIKINYDHFSNKSIEVYPGPEYEQLSDIQKEALSETEFTISKENNRMAYQLDQTVENSLQPIITSIVMPGTVQLTPSGKLIVLMPDCQTTGGYPRIFQLSDNGINILSQKFTGANIKFRLIK